MSIRIMIKPSAYDIRSRPVLTLVVYFAAWKFLVVLLALSSPGVGYDTSTDLVIRDATQIATARSILWERLAGKLLRWDAIYFHAIAQHGYQFEQEWAFGWGFTQALAFLSNRMSNSHEG